MLTRKLSHKDNESNNGNLLLLKAHFFIQYTLIINKKQKEMKRTKIHSVLSLFVFKVQRLRSW